VQVNISLNPTFFGAPTTTSGTLNVYGRVFGNQFTAAQGSYTDSFSGANAQLTINQRGQFLAPPASPNTCVGGTAEANFAFSVTATVQRTCFITATPTTLDFGSVGLLNTARNGTSTISVQCVSGTPYKVGLDGGLHSGSDISARRMAQGTNSVAYQLYRDAARTLVWGNTPGSDMVAATGTGSPQILTVYGQVPAQPTPPAGTYQDTVVVSVTY
jgi:spore coat protein U-like protein